MLLAVQEVPNEAWQQHCYMGYGAPGGNQLLQYGQPTTLQAFADLAQIANYVQYRWVWLCLNPAHELPARPGRLPVLLA